jgi:hypothetical protein
MKENLYHLQMIKGSVDDNLFKLVAASMLTNYYLKVMKKKEARINRSKLLDRVNLTLRSIGVAEISYGFVRSYC